MTLCLADGTRWCIRAGDEEAVRVVQQLAQVMDTTVDVPQSFTHELLVLTAESQCTPSTGDFDQSMVCVVDRPMDETMLTIAMTHVALAVANASLARGGMLLHGALAACPNVDDPHDQAGVILAGPGMVGKSTASSRIQFPWYSLCDDATLVVRDAQGSYWAHPWPTWSRFYNCNNSQPAPGGKWRVERAVPLRALFFLSQAEQDRVDARSPAQAIAMLMEVINHVNHPIARRMSPQRIHSLRRHQLSNAQALADAIPAYTLHISLTGAFWEEIEKVLPYSAPTQPSLPQSAFVAQSKSVANVDARLDDGLLHFVYRGPSMNPTLREPDLVTVRPYNGRPIRHGDVIYYRSPDEDKMVVHRVVEVNLPSAPQACLRTRGDNNPVLDPYFLPVANINGQAVAAQRGRRKRRIHGGWNGIVVVFWIRLWRRLRRVVDRFLSGAYRGLASTGLAAHLWRRWMPARLHPRVVVYQARPFDTYKLLVGLREVGAYYDRQKYWEIHWPYRWIIFEKDLPIPKNLHKPLNVIMEKQIVLDQGE